MMPTHASTWTTGTASVHCLPRMTGTKSGATTTSPPSIGTATTAMMRPTRAHVAAMRSGSSWMREKAGEKTR